MICKNCGKDITWNLIDYKPKESLYLTSIPDYYKEYTWVKACGICNAVIDYKDLPIERFFNWLNICDEKQDPSKNLKGKALIRYFGLDKLLELKKDAGD